MKMELIAPDTLTLQLQQKLLILKETLAQLILDRKNQPKGHLRVAQKNNGRPQYYHYTTPDDLTGKYIRKKNINFARILAQKDYNEEIILQLQKEIAALETYLSQTTSNFSKFYTTLCPGRRTLVTPVTLTNEKYAAQWLEKNWTGLPFAQDAPFLSTANGERVRSKSEIIIADTLYRYNIPYRYEFPLTLHRSEDHTTVTLHPDFLCLNTRTRQEIFWEHFGRMDEPEYAKNAAGKLRLYTENEILPGRNLIITMETKTEPPSTRALEKLITEFLT